jgi:hypothetical protein
VFSSGSPAELREAWQNNFSKCRFPPACLGARNYNMKGQYKTCESDPHLLSTERDECDPSQKDSLEGCHEEAGYRKTCAIMASRGFATAETGGTHVCRICARCREGYQRSAQGLGFKCEKCPDRRENGWRLSLGGFGALLSGILLVKLGMSDVLEGNPSDAMNRILLNFMQVIAVFAAFPLQWPAPVLELFKISQAVSVLGESLVNPDCELSFAAADMFYYKMLGWSAVPVCTVLFTFFVWGLFACCKGVPWDQELKPHTDLNREAKRTRGPDASAHVVEVELAEAPRTWLGLGAGASSTEQSSTRKGGSQAKRTNAKLSSKLALRDNIDASFEEMVRKERLGHIEASVAFRNMLLLKLKQRVPTPKDHFCVSTVILLYLCYPSMCKNTFRLMICTRVGDQMFLSADPEQMCWVGRHLLMVLVACVPQLILYVLGMPIAALVVLFRNRHHLEGARTKYRWGVLYVGLKPERYYWDFVVALRKAAVFSLSVLGSTGENLAIQTHLAMLVLFLSLLGHLVGRPYESEWLLLDVFEVSGLVVCWILMWSGIVFYLDGIDDQQREITTAVLMLINIGYAVVVGIILIRQKAEEGATWTVVMRRRICCMVSDRRLRCLGNLIPRINPATRYVREMSLMHDRKTFAQERDMIPSFDRVGGGQEEQLLSDPVRHISTSSVEWSHNPQLFDLASAQSSLPDGWYVERDPQSGMMYYFTMEGKTSWQPPQPGSNSSEGGRQSRLRTVSSLIFGTKA